MTVVGNNTQRKHSNTSTKAQKENSYQVNTVVNESALQMFYEEGAALVEHVYRTLRTHTMYSGTKH